jgi:hypothetical protein
MTLLIALILMDHIGGFHWFSYVLVVALWLFHLAFHAATD